MEGLLGVIFTRFLSKRSYWEAASNTPLVLKGKVAGSVSMESWMAAVTGPVLEARGLASRSK